LTHHGIENNYGMPVSSSVLYRKSTGNLFKIYLNQIRQEHETKAIHFGDNLDSDYRKPKQLSIKCFWLPRIKSPSDIAIKLARKFLSFRLRKISYRSDINIASKVISNFFSELTQMAKQSKTIYYIGSEGAFFSKLAWNMIPNSQICLNFGRKSVLEALASIRIQYVLSKMILENCNIPELISFFQLNDKDSAGLLFKTLIFSPQELDFKYIQECLKENSSRSMIVLQGLEFKEGDLFVDVGYKGSFIRALTLLFNIDFNYLQLFGNKFECSDFSYNWRSLYQSEDKSCISYFKINTRMVEVLFSDGPRAPMKNLVIRNFVNSLNVSKPGLVRNLTLHKFFNSPSSKLAIGIESVAHEDDLKKTWY